MTILLIGGLATKDWNRGVEYQEVICRKLIDLQDQSVSLARASRLSEVLSIVCNERSEESRPGADSLRSRHHPQEYSELQKRLISGNFAPNSPDSDSCTSGETMLTLLVMAISQNLWHVTNNIDRNLLATP